MYFNVIDIFLELQYLSISFLIVLAISGKIGLPLLSVPFYSILRSLHPSIAPSATTMTHDFPLFNL